MSLRRGAARGAALGLAWGVAARVWMRAISTDPEFSWAGTLTILGFATWLGLGLGLLGAARSQGRAPWWGLFGLPGLALFASPGAVFLPALGLGGLAVALGGPVARLVGGLATALPGAALWWMTRNEPSPDAGSLFVTVSGAVALSVALAVAGAPLWTSSSQRGALRPDRGVVPVAGVHDRRVG